jgi:CheY-like chemotaxis protein
MTVCKTGMGADRRLKMGYLLIVDSNVHELLYTSMLLQQFDYNVCTAMKGAEALEMATNAIPSLIMSDSVLVDMPGLELIQGLKRNFRTAAVPLVVKSHEISPQHELQYREAGVAAFLRSGLNAEELFRTIQKAIESTPRSNIRIRTRLPVIVNGRTLDSGKGECISDLSEHGIYIRTLEFCPINSRVSVQIFIGSRTIAVEAQVLYCHTNGTGPFREPGMGLKFVTISEQDQEYLRAFIKGEIMKEIPES